ncbi:MAG: hypothetical protein DRR16_26275 [Candidatus Parabeggiatoa sp. nov. 3]|jgi:uncharacterized protein YgiM (DUF1202 family)|nr:MAG: hypothetical protein DRR00_17810 [Gammaproteobacteria bacterium]RKZ65959.1 MAG: hypothetical protein DRQ99_11150 [Gammaproteobacteria bacterium]RKZ79153.1 MAG: hypothetical protein DRR16_26275 [Gammaproteobacteria bacterium]
MNNGIIKLLSLGLLFIASVTVPVWAYECGVVITQRDSLNIRENPSQRAKLIDTALKGSTLRILETKKTWYKVKLNNGKMGYGSRDYIKKLTPKSPEKCGIVITKESPLNIRLEASTWSPIIGAASKDSALRISQIGKTWHLVMLNHTDQKGDIILGFASKDYVSIVNDQ